jgi:catechol 2,3-dioxygenase-like lactoylglutathione lyase family enzyme
VGREERREGGAVNGDAMKMYAGCVPVSFDHIALPARDDEASARFLGSVLGLPVTRDGAEDEIPCVRLAEGRQILFQRADSFSSQHVAFRVSPEEFIEVLERLRSMTVPFGNEPDAPSNGLVTDPLGGQGRVYFLDPNGHLLEVCA